MGSMVAAGWAEAVQDGLVGLKVAVYSHLTGNFYPPVNPVFVDVAIAAIQAVEDEENDRMIDMPNGKTLQAIEIVDGLRLDHFVQRWQDEDFWASDPDFAGTVNV